MGKYTDNTFPQTERDCMRILCNEIAESNRLARLKMEGNSRYDNLSSDQYRRFRKDDLEDKA